jgi:hypothetical protein
MPIGVVSKEYRLVQHTEVLARTVRALNAAKIPVDAVSCELAHTTYGERMALRLQLPRQYDFDPGDGEPMGLRLECFNSVDGSTRFMAVFGWLRFVCSNGLIIGVRRATILGRHDRRLDVDDIEQVLTEGLRSVQTEKTLLVDWLKRLVDHGRLGRWVDGPLASAWGKKAAARVYHIVTTGNDAEFEYPFERAKPTQRRMTPGKPVPGAPVPGRTAFAVSQALAWLARERRDVQEQFERSRTIPELMQRLLAEQ